MEHPKPASPLVNESHCSNLRHKGMYVHPDDVVEGDFSEALGATSYWCVCTQKAFGPDGGAVNARDCVHGRRCCDH
jgi:hypothetical protein